MRRNVDALWDKAYRISKKSWHPMEPRKNRGSFRKPYNILAATNSAPSRVPSAFEFRDPAGGGQKNWSRRGLAAMCAPRLTRATVADQPQLWILSG